MKRIFKSLFLLSAILPLILASCADYPTIPTTSPKLITSTSSGMSNFSPAQKFSITMFITPDEACPTGGFYNLFAMDITPSGGGTQQYVAINIDCSSLAVEVMSNMFTTASYTTLFSSGFGPLSAFLTFDLALKSMRLEIQSETNKITGSKSLSTAGLAFDSNTKLYLCADQDGTSTQACTVSQFIIEYRYFDPVYSHLSGADPVVAGFYPLRDASLAPTIGSASSAYFGDDETNPTPATVPTWASSKNFVTISSGQFLSFPLLSISSTMPTVAFDFSCSAWIKITNIPASATTIFSTYSATGAQVGVKLIVQSSKQLWMQYGSNFFDIAGSVVPSVTLDTWQFVGFTAYFNTDQRSISGTILFETSVFHFISSGSPVSGVDVSTASVLRIGDASNSFAGHISLVRIMTPGGGISRTTDLCSSKNSVELGVGSFALVCSGNNALSVIDNKCYSSCPTGSTLISGAPTSICVSSPEGEESSQGSSVAIIAAIAGGSFVIFALAGWSIYNFKTKRFPFGHKRSAKEPYVDNKTPVTLEAPSQFSPTPTEVNPLTP